MKPAIKRAWVKALRSGKYKQGRGRLRMRENTFCCLGVLCDLHNKQLKRSLWKRDHSISGHWLYGKKYNDAVLTNGVMRWAGLRQSDPRVGEFALTQCNDAFKLDFKRIARLIEKHL